jgi:hypothetical protein
MKSFVGQNSVLRDFLLFGVGVVACLMLKWSVAVMMLSLVCSIGWCCWRNGMLERYVKGLMAGLILGCMPFAIYFSVMGIWADMWQNYFINTFSSVSMPLADTLMTYAGEWKNLLTTRRILYLIYTLPVLMLWRKSDWFTSMLPALCGLFFVAVSIRHDFFHYVTIAGPFAILTIVMAMRWIIHHRVRLRYIAVVTILAVCYVVLGSIYYSDAFCTKAGERFDHYMAVSAAMSKVSENPKIIHVGMENGLCMGTTLPGTRYWATQYGRTEQMWKEELAGIRSGNADFVRCPDDMPKYLQRILDEAGYVHWQDDLFVKTIPPELGEVKHFTILDIIRKKTYQDAYFGE